MQREKWRGYRVLLIKYISSGGRDCPKPQPNTSYQSVPADFDLGSDGGTGASGWRRQWVEPAQSKHPLRMASHVAPLQPNLFWMSAILRDNLGDPQFLWTASIFMILISLPGSFGWCYMCTCVSVVQVDFVPLTHELGSLVSVGSAPRFYCCKLMRATLILKRL